MDKQEAMIRLQAMRPNGADALDPAFAEALALVEADPELKTWWERQQAFDRAVAARFAAVPVPTELREAILAQANVAALRPQPRLLGWLAIAASVAILCVAGTFLHTSRYGPLEADDYTHTVLPMLHHDAPDLAMLTPDHDKIAAWLKSQHSPVGTLPDKMTTLATVGCQKFDVHGHAVSLICFTMPQGGLAHLFVSDEQMVSDPGPIGVPKFDNIDEWSTASWTDGKMFYVLASRGGNDAVKQLL